MERHHQKKKKKRKNRSSYREVFYKKVFLEILQKSQESNCASVLFWREACNYIKKKLAQLFSCKVCKISKNTFYYMHAYIPGGNIKHF